MKAVERKILNQLLDKYEKSKLSRGENRVAIRISIRFSRQSMPEYFDENSVAYDEIHHMLMLLEEKGYIRIQWKNNQTGHIVEKIFLREENVEDVYAYMKRVPVKEKEQEVLAFLSRVERTDLAPYTCSFVKRMQNRIREGKSIKEYADISRIKELEELVHALNETEKNETECFFREFSVRIFRDSKKYEEFVHKICRILREEGDEFDGMEREEILSEFSIYHNPNYVYVKGQAELVCQGKTVDVGMFVNGIGVTVQKGIHIKESNEIRYVYTIENLTTFFRFEREHSLILYLGGYHNRANRQFLQEIYKAFPAAKYYHFGDIDAGGFQIYYHLRKRTDIPFERYQMDVQTLRLYESSGKRLTERDRMRLSKLRDSVSETEVKECIQYMLAHNVKLEQECIPFTSATASMPLSAVQY